jgi:hypothetical protein
MGTNCVTNIWWHQRKWVFKHYMYQRLSGEARAEAGVHRSTIAIFLRQ